MPIYSLDWVPAVLTDKFRGYCAHERTQGGYNWKVTAFVLRVLNGSAD